MKVILLKDIDGLGKKYEIKDAKDGYVRNFLLPKKLIKPATKEALKWLEKQKETIEQIAEEDLKKSQELASKLDGLEVVIDVKVGEEGQLFESINAQKISDKLKEMGFEVKKSQIKLEKPIKDTGEYNVGVQLDHNLETEIKVIITEASQDVKLEEDI